MGSERHLSDHCIRSCHFDAKRSARFMDTKPACRAESSSILAASTKQIDLDAFLARAFQRTEQRAGVVRQQQVRHNQSGNLRAPKRLFGVSKIRHIGRNQWWNPRLGNGVAEMEHLCARTLTPPQSQMQPLKQMACSPHDCKHPCSTSACCVDKCSVGMGVLLNKGRRLADTPNRLMI